MKKDSRTRLFEVMGRLDKTFTAPKLNEEFEPASPVAFKQPMGGEVGGNDFDTEKAEQTPEEKLEALTAKVDELYALLHGEESEESEEPEPESEEGEGVENLQEWNFDKKKGEKEGKGEDDTKEHEDSETPAEEKAEHEKGGYEFGKKEKHEVEEGSKPKIPVNMIAKVGK
jgi:hypothetical protein